MDEKIISTINKIKLLAEQNPEFNQAMQKLFGHAASAPLVYASNKVTDDVSAIREALEIRANKSISYNFIKEQRLRDQLIIDNLRMENAALNLQYSESERFYLFCLNAFYQIENLVNYYFHKTFLEFEDLELAIQKHTEQENENFRYTVKGKKSDERKSVSDIPVVHKINAICSIFLFSNTIKWTLGTLRQLRNEGEHRCMVITEEKNEDNNLYKFFKNNTFSSVRAILKILADAVETHVGKPIVHIRETFDATITSMLPSACYVKFNGHTEILPYKLFSKIKDKQKGDVVTITVVNNKIIDLNSK